LTRLARRYMSATVWQGLRIPSTDRKKPVQH
jgi:hypothetical protein